MKIELPKPDPTLEPAIYFGGGITSPYADPPLAPVFILGMRDGGRVTLTEQEARNLNAHLGKWVRALDTERGAR